MLLHNMVNDALDSIREVLHSIPATTVGGGVSDACHLTITNIMFSLGAHIEHASNSQTQVPT